MDYVVMEVGMTRRKTFLATALLAGLAAATLGFGSTAAQAHGFGGSWGYGYMGPGMMWGYGPDYHGGYGPGWMQGYGPDYRSGRRYRGYRHAYGRRYSPAWGGYGPGWMHGWMHGGYGPGRGYGPGWMHGGYGPGWCWRNDGYHGAGSATQPDLNLTVDQVKARMERWLAYQGNSHLKLGDVKEKDANTITADIVTADNSLVQRFVIDRNTGYYRPADEEPGQPSEQPAEKPAQEPAQQQDGK